MIKLENTEVSGWGAAVRGMRNPMNSWDKSDSFFGCTNGDYGKTLSCDCNEQCRCDCSFIIGPNDLKLMRNLVDAGTDHSKFMRMINVTVDVTAPLYWWKEVDTYKVGTVRNSCSTMHKVTEKEFDLSDFSHEHMLDDTYYVMQEQVIELLNTARELYLKTKDKRYWWQIIQLLPSSYNQKATLQLNYAVLRNIFHSRKNHKLDEWIEFCVWVGDLPFARELIVN